MHYTLAPIFFFFNRYISFAAGVNNSLTSTPSPTLQYNNMISSLILKCILVHVHVIVSCSVPCLIDVMCDVHYYYIIDVIYVQLV